MGYIVRYSFPDSQPEDVSNCSRGHIRLGRSGREAPSEIEKPS